MAKPLSFKELLTKLSNVFNKDMYVIENSYCISGPETEAESIPTFLIHLNPEYVSLFSLLGDTKDIIYISDIKKAKTNEKDYIEIINKNNMNYDSILNKYNELLNIEKNNKWNSYNMTEEEAEDIFKNSKTVYLSNNEELKNIELSKKLFPLITNKNYSILEFNIRLINNDELFRIYTAYYSDWFKIYSEMYYLNI